MADMDSSNEVIKLLTFVFEDEAPLPVVERLNLTDGLYLAPISPLLLHSDGDYHLMGVAPGFSQFFRDHLHKSTLNVAYSGRKDLNYEGGKSDEATAKRDVDNYLLSALIYSPRFLTPYAAFVSLPDENRICHSARMKDFGYLGKSEHDVLTESEFTRINQLYASIKAILADEKTGKLPIALKYYQQAFRSDIDWSVRFLGLMMAMEALFGQGATEIAHQVSERTAFILKQSPDEREKLYKSMKSFYALRSKIAHGGSPVDGRKNMETPFEQLLRILRDSLIRIIEDSAILSLFWSSSRDQFDKAMRNLLFCGTMMIES